MDGGWKKLALFNVDLTFFNIDSEESFHPRKKSPTMYEYIFIGYINIFVDIYPERNDS